MAVESVAEYAWNGWPNRHGFSGRMRAEYAQWGEAARLAVPTAEHFLPLLYILAMQKPDDTIVFFAEKVTLGSISMRSLQIG